MLDLHGKHLIAGEWVAGETTFESDPSEGEKRTFPEGTEADIDRAAKAAEDAFWSYAYSDRAERAAFLDRIADEIDARGEAITAIGSQETGLPAGRLEGERGRTTGQLRLFARHLEKGDYLDRLHDPALPDRKPMPRPDIRAIQRPIGPVGVFGASNFPLAFSTAGGDTAAALAAGCPVVVKGHGGHPGTGELVAQAIDAAVRACGLHPGVFGFVQGGGIAVGQALAKHPLIKAVAFTGSLRGGRALFDTCARRPEPIPFFGELGSINPMFLMPAALKARGGEIGKGWAGSLTMGAGQFCTSPGIAVVVDGPEADAFAEAAVEALHGIEKQGMLTEGIAEAFRTGSKRMGRTQGVRELVGTTCATRHAAPYLFETSGADWLGNHELGEEVFGPLGVIVRAKDADEMRRIALGLEGQLTCTLHLDPSDEPDAARLMPILERKAGRILANGFPTGVEVCDAMVHGGPYPATTNFGHTSVGTLAIRRFLRPVCFQAIPDALLPEALR
jgi:NADP-dependent aldehyde dehydrogenase